MYIDLNQSSFRRSAEALKVSLLLPVVAKADAPYRGYGESEVVADHDLWLP